MKKKIKIKNIIVMSVLGIAVLFFINISLAANTAKINVETANLREKADSNSKILEQLSLNEEVEILEKDGDWYKVKAKGITGYLRQDLITVKENSSNTETENKEPETTQETETSKTEEPTTQSENNETTKLVAEDTKLKIVPAINATDIIEVKKEEEVTITETINDWVCIQTKTTKGWIRKDKLKSV